MSAGISVTQSADLITSTLPKMPRGKWTDTYKLQQCPLLENTSGDDRRKSSGGTKFEARIRLRSNLTAKGVDLFEINPVVRIKLLEKLGVDWCHSDADLLYDAREMSMNTSDQEQIINWLSTQEAGQLEDLGNWWEENGWLPPVSATDNKNPAGVPMWIRTLAIGVNDPVGGFNGVTAYYRNGASTTLYGGVDSSIADNNRLRNWAATHSGMTVDTVNLIRTAKRRVRFKSPPNMDGKGNTNVLSQFKLYMSQDFGDQYEALVNAGPDDRNNDAAPANGDNFTITGLKYDTVPALDAVTYQPIYGINHRSFYMVTLRTTWMEKGKPLPAGGNPLIIQQKIFASGNFFNDNPRSCFVLHRQRAA